jgi:hypothetical protein
VPITHGETERHTEIQQQLEQGHERLILPVHAYYAVSDSLANKV